MTEVPQIKEQIIQWVAQAFPEMYANKAEQLIIPFGSTGVLIDVAQLTTGMHRLYLSCPVAVCVPDSEELAAWIGRKAGNYLFGSPGLRREEDAENSAQTVEFEYSVHFEGISQRSLIELIKLIASSGLELADEVRSRFGGDSPM